MKQNLDFFEIFFIKVSSIKFQVNPTSGAVLIHVDRRKDILKLTGALSDDANAQKKRKKKKTVNLLALEFYI